MEPIDQDRFEGCLLGLALGDALGAPLEGGPLERLTWRALGHTRRGEMRWTDDTQMSLDLAESLIALGRLDPDDLARRFAASYRWHRGYGSGAARLLKRIARGADWREANRSVYPDGSYGNGAAMRAPVVGIFRATRPEELPAAARQSARLTHAHPLGIEGAVLVAAAVAQAAGSRDPKEILRAASARCELAPFTDRLRIARTWLESGCSTSPPEAAARLGHGVAAPESCVTALYAALRFLPGPFAELHAFVAACGGDVDTIGAMAGAIWGAANGAAALPQPLLLRLEQWERISDTARCLHAASG